jgi:hypothetical protein
VNRRDADHGVERRQRREGRLGAGRRVHDAGRGPADIDEVDIAMQRTRLSAGR